MIAARLVIVLSLLQALACSRLADFPDKSPEDATVDVPDDGVDAGEMDAAPDIDPDVTDATDPEEDGEPCIDEIPRLTAVRISDDENYSRGPTLAWTGSEYGVAWHDDRHGDDEIFFARLSQDGVIMITEVRITTAGSSTYPSLAWTGSEFGLCWTDDRDAASELYFARISGEGTKIDSDVRITDYFDLSRYPDLVWSGSEFGVTWEDQRDGNREIYFARISATGTKPGVDVRITEEGSGSGSPTIAWSGSEYGITWWDSRATNDEIYFALVSPTGVKSTGDVRITFEGTLSREPSIAWTGSEYGVSWYDNRDTDYEIYFARITAEGTKRGEDIRITNETSQKLHPSLVWSGREYAVCWQDDRNGMYDLYFTRLTGTGTKIGEDERATGHSSDSQGPSLVWTGSEYGYSWWDTRDGNNEIYFNILWTCP